MMALLDAGERETVFTVCGVLINLMSDEELKPKLKDEDGIKKWVLSCNENERMCITCVVVKRKLRLKQKQIIVVINNNKLIIILL